MTNRRYYGFLDLVVIAAVIRVVINHALNNFFILTTGKALGFHAMPTWGTLVYSLVRFSVPAFVLVAGFKYGLSLQSNQNLPYFPYLSKRLKRLLRPYLIWTIIYYISIPRAPFILASNHSAFHNYPFPTINTIWRILNGSGHPAYQLWFIPMFLLLVVFYPFIRRSVPFMVSQPILWAVYFLIRYYTTFHDLGQPFVYPMYFAFYELGLLLTKLVTHHENSLFLRYITPPVTLLLGSGFTILELKAFSPFQNYLGIVGSEIFVSLALFFLCYLILPGSAPASLKYLSGYVWPVFIMHEPLILGSLAWIVYINYGLRHPVDLVFVTISTLLISGSLYTLFKKIKLSSILF